ncbi:MAG: phosphoribosylglycinamide formyltransferase [Oscillospiraceae bacterium]|nr:phosphoribosylglycinamide formyltransferase [Oscillospiraceae bacterium]
MLKARIAVLVSGGGTNLQALLDSQGTLLNSGEIVLVVSNNANAYALQRAAKAGVESAVVLKKDGCFEERLIALLEEKQIDLIILAGFMSILSAGFTSRFANRILNVHPSLIPSFCSQGYYGLRVDEEDLRCGGRITGATVHLVNEIPDGGRILLQKAVAIEENDTPEVLQKRVMEQAEWLLLPRAAELMSREILEATHD